MKKLFILDKIDARIIHMNTRTQPIGEDSVVGAVDLDFEIYTKPDILKDLGCANLLPALWSGKEFKLEETRMQRRFGIALGFQHHDVTLSIHKTSHEFKDCRVKKFLIKPVAGQAEVRFQVQIVNPHAPHVGWLFALSVDCKHAADCEIQVQPGPQGELLPEDKAKAANA